MAECTHPDFVGFVEVFRIFDDEAREANPLDTLPDRFSCELRVFCAVCDEPFEFVGFPTGLSPRGPMVDVAAHELRLPVVPTNAPAEWQVHAREGAGFTVSVETMPGRKAN